MVNGDTNEMTVKLMDIRKPFEKKESGFFKRTQEREDRRRLGKKNTTVFFFFGIYMFTWSTGNRFPTKLKLTVKIKTT